MNKGNGRKESEKNGKAIKLVAPGGHPRDEHAFKTAFI